LFDSEAIPHAETNSRAIDLLREHEEVEDGDLVLVSKGDYANVHGGTNTMKIIKVGAVIT